MSCRARRCWTACGAARIEDSSTASSRLCTRDAASCESKGGSRRCVGLDTGSSSRPELAAALHRLRSTLARAKAELELAHTDGESPPPDRLLSDLREALQLLGQVEAIALSIVPVLVLDDDERLRGLTAR